MKEDVSSEEGKDRESCEKSCFQLESASASLLLDDERIARETARPNRNKIKKKKKDRKDKLKRRR